MKLLIANPHGFCSGVTRAVQTAREVLRRHNPVYCLNEIVHNRIVVDELAAEGVIFTKNLEAIPEGSPIIFSAHGVPPAVRETARQRHLKVIDATCPFVEKVHREVIRYAAAGYTILYIGHRKHDEAIGVTAEAPTQTHILETPEEAAAVVVPDPTRVAVVSQTTLGTEMHSAVFSVLKARFPNLQTPSSSDICYATANRQTAVRELARRTDYVIVLGSPASSNSKRLVESARSVGTPAELVNTPAELEALSLTDIQTLGLTSGASTPEHFLETVTETLKARFPGLSVEDFNAVSEQEFTFPQPPIPV